MAESTPRRVRVSVPATSANFGPGFDAIGAALDLRGEVELWLHDEAAGSGDRGHDMALEAVERVFRYLGRPAPSIRVAIHSGVPVARGLGASAIVRAGAAVGALALAGAPYDPEWLLALTSELEGHADNAAPALFGGLQVVVADDDRIQHVQVPLPDGLRAVLFVPDFEMSTDEGRRLLPASLSRGDAVHNSSRAALLVAGLATGRLDVLQTATDDRLHQPARSKLFPAMHAVFEAAVDAGAVCAFLSGGGSSILAIAQAYETEIAEAMTRAAAQAGVSGHSRVAGFSDRGAEIVAVD
jgi:homoserine kinase